MADVSCQTKSQDVAKISLGKTYLIISLTALLISVCLGYVYWAGNEMLTRQGPQTRAVIQLQLDMTLTHLSLEEVISKDSDMDLDQILAPLDRAQTWTQILLDGGNSRVGKIMPLRDAQTRDAVEQMHSQLTRFRQITLERWENQTASAIAPPLNKAYDHLFQELLDQARKIQKDLGTLSEHQLKILKTIQLSLMGVCLLTALSVSGLMTRMLARQIHDSQALLATNQQLEASNQQLHASDQQLRAANQQLEASNQQLRATNQQLEASDQQMHAVNQQLTASEQQVRAERDKAQRYFNLAGTMLVVMGRDGCVERINQKGCEVIGAAENEIVGKDWFRHFLPEPMQTPVRSVFDQLVAGEIEPVEFYENSLQTANGEQRLIAWHNTVLRDDRGNIMGILSSGEDITNHRLAETSLRESQQRLHQLIDAAPYGAFEYELSPNDHLVFVGYNQAANRILNTDCSQFIGKTIEEAFPPLAQTPIPTAYRRVAATGERYEDEQMAYSNDQITGAYEISAFQTEPQRMAVFFRDITERKRATEALEKERTLIVRLMETSPVGILMTDATGQIRFANAPAELILGLTKDEIMGRTYNDPQWHIADYEGNHFPDEHLPFNQVMDKLKPVYGIRHAIEWPDGRRTLLSVNAAPLLDQDRQFTGMVTSVEDVTEYVQAEKKVLQYQSQLRALVSQLTLSEERERKRLAVELHDGICQSLAMAKLKVDEQLVNHSLSTIHGLLQEMQQTLVCIIDDTRSLTNNLGTPMLQQMGLHVALEKWLDTEISARHGIKTEVVNKGTPRSLDDDTKALLFRAVRELATNVVKHAQARTLTVTLDTRANELCLTIADDGTGFNCPVLTEQDFRQGGYGLFSIYERITYVGGDMTIDSSPGKGTKIILHLPLNKQSEQHNN